MRIFNISEKSLALCGRIINPLVLSILATGAKKAGRPIHGVCSDSLKKEGIHHFHVPKIQKHFQARL